MLTQCISAPLAGGFPAKACDAAALRRPTSQATAHARHFELATSDRSRVLRRTARLPLGFVRDEANEHVGISGAYGAS